MEPPFEHVPALGAYREGLPLVGAPGPKWPHAVLLVHGYSASPAAFAPLVAELGRRGLPYYAPALSGFGLDDLGPLRAARGEDWRRDVFMAYELLAALAEHVSVVAASFGTLPATELARERPVRHLVLVAPYFHLQGALDRRARAVFSHGWARALAARWPLLVAKPVRPGRATCVDLCDPAAAARFFQYPRLPLASLVRLWRYPRDQDMRGLRCGSLDVLWGEQEQTSDVPGFLRDLEAAGVPHCAHAYPRSGHNLLNDYDGAAAVALIADLLTGPPPPSRPPA